ncbi:MAG: MarR family transcriptional regulator [Thermoleophilia bacterium]|nr:MarR family transcriptional regulator [Thermoleophilia bacterium]
MNRETTRAPRAEVAARATVALEAAAVRAARRLERHAADYELSDAKLEVLAVLGECESRCCCLHELGDELRVTRPNVTKLVDGLERCGMVERVRHPTDGRMVQARLTAAGAALAERALPGRTTSMQDYWDVLDDEEIETLTGLLERVSDPARTRGEIRA